MLKTVFTLAGTSLVTSYTASNAINPGRFERVRFYVHNVRSAGSGATTTTIKLQFRYNNDATQTVYLDLPTYRDDVQGAAQPKGPTFDIEHAFTSTANATTAGSFYLADARGLVDLTVNVKVNATGQSGDTTTVFMAA